MGQTPKHLKLPELKAFSGRLLTAIALNGGPNDQMGQDAARAHRTLRENIARDADSLCRHEGPLHKGLDTFSKRWVKREPGRSEQLDQQVKQLRALVRKIDCVTCADGEAYICRGTPKHDDAVIARGGVYCTAQGAPGFSRTMDGESI